MKPPPARLDRSAPPPRRWPALAAWGAAWAAMLALDGRVDLANLAMLLVLGASVAALWLPAAASFVASALAVITFNWLFVPPRGTLAIDLRNDALLLGAMLVVSWIVAGLMAAQRGLAQRARRAARQAGQLRALGDALRDADDPQRRADALQAALAEVVGAPAKLMLAGSDGADDALLVGEPDAAERAALWLCREQSRPFGPGTGVHEDLHAWVLPLRGRGASFGAAIVALPEPAAPDAALRAQAQALCDQMGLALQRAAALQAAAAAREQAQTQAVRNALLAAISHDHRTPLATILGAASSLAEQDERLSPEQRRRLAATIVDETTQLARLTDNTLQLARLDAPGVELRLDWESAEEIVGAVLRRARQHDPARRVRAYVEAGLPLLRCDALLLAQLLDNLVDNGLKYGDPKSPVDIDVRREGGRVAIAVRDRGPGVERAERDRIFEAFRRGEAPGGARPGAGVGLAVCRAIARAHGGDIVLRPRAGGGSSFECRLPLPEPPRVAAEEEPVASERERVMTESRGERRAAPKPARIPLGDRPTYPSGEGSS